MGSAIHAQSLVKEGAAVEAMISLEMLGYFTDQPRTQSYPLRPLGLLYPSVGDFIAIVGRLGDRRALWTLKGGMVEVGGVPVRSMTSPIEIPELGFSDHRNYWLAGFSALMITDTSFFRNPNYHTAADSPDTLDYDRMAVVTRMIAHALRTWE
jgi:Zn-dependent M28 family amino/carboxypeptidase